MEMVSTGTGRKRSVLLYIFETITAVALVLNCTTMWSTLKGIRDHYDTVIFALTLIGLLGCILASGYLFNLRKFLIAMAFSAGTMAFLLIYVYMTWVTNHEFFRLVIVACLLIFYYFLSEDITEPPRLLVRLSYVITVIAAISVICWILFTLVKVTPATSVEYTYWNGQNVDTKVKSFFMIYFTPQGTRNCGIFAEAPIAGFVYSIGLLVQLFLRKKSSWVASVILIIAVASTRSAFGYAACAVALIAKLIITVIQSEKYKNMSKGKRVGIPVLIIVLVCVIVAGFVYFYGRKIGGESWTLRIEDFKGAFQAFLSKPAFGNGYLNTDAIKAFYEGARQTGEGFSCSNSLGWILSDGGIWFGILYCVPFIFAIVKSIRHKEPKIFFFVLISFGLFSVIVVPYKFISILLILFYGAYRSRIYLTIKNKLRKVKND